jgi:hypothetical protein
MLFFLWGAGGGGPMQRDSLQQHMPQIRKCGHVVCDLKKKKMSPWKKDVEEKSQGKSQGKIRGEKVFVRCVPMRRDWLNKPQNADFPNSSMLLLLSLTSRQAMSGYI